MWPFMPKTGCLRPQIFVSWEQDQKVVLSARERDSCFLDFGVCMETGLYL